MALNSPVIDATAQGNETTPYSCTALHLTHLRGCSFHAKDNVSRRNLRFYFKRMGRCHDLQTFCIHFKSTFCMFFGIRLYPCLSCLYIFSCFMTVQKHEFNSFAMFFFYFLCSCFILTLFYVMALV
jgi:hypothetical protein